MKKYYIDEIIKWKDKDGNEDSMRGFYLYITDNTARIEVPSDICEDDLPFYEEEIDINQKTFNARYYNDNIPVHVDDGKLIGELIIDSLNILNDLNKDGLLGKVGIMLIENWEDFPKTIENMEGRTINEITTSSLTGTDEIKAIEEWIDEDEQTNMYKLLGITKNNIKIIMAEKRISIRKLASDLKIAYANAYDLVNREDLSDTKLGTLIRIADYLGVDIKDLYKG